uniref:Retrotransposon gag domain-containing protein n=1 Tax=Fagus sylvatica TaxID=28930 RepID=A0A2N9J017_FAGSY
MAEERVIPPEAPRMTMYQLLHPTQSSIPSCIMFPPNAPHVEIKQGLMAILPDFRGLENENPYVHVRAFEEVIGSFYAQNVIETAKLRFFPFSLKDKAKGWLYTLKPRSIGSWGEMTQEFYKKFFPPHKVQQVKRKISNFAQGNDETLFMAWERFKDTYNFCPTHGYDTLEKEPEDAMDYLDEIAENSNTWNGPSPLDSTDRNRSSTTTSGGSVFRLREEDNMNAKISLLTKEIEALKLKGSRGVNAVYREDPMEACRICQEIDHTTSACKSLSQFLNVPEEQVCAFNQYRPNNSSYSNNYNPNMRNHPYLSYKSENVLNPTGPRNFDTSHTTSSSSRLPLEDVLYTFIQKQGEQNQRFDTMFTRIDEEMRETKSQVARLTEALSRTERGKLPSQTQPNPNNQTAKVIKDLMHCQEESITVKKTAFLDRTRNGRMKITFGSMTAELNIFNVNPQQLVDEECEYVNFIEATPQEEFNKNCFSNSFETLPVNSIVSNELKPAAKIFDSSLLDSLQILEEEQVVIAKKPPRSKKKSLLAYSDAPKLRLKKTPKGLPLASIEPHATSAVEVPSKESVDQEVEKAKVRKPSSLRSTKRRGKYFKIQDCQRNC